MIPLTLANFSDQTAGVAILVAGISTLFVTLGKVAQLLLQRTDTAHAELIASLNAAHAEALDRLSTEVASLWQQLEAERAIAKQLRNQLTTLMKDEEVFHDP